jgi:hypothetical protein
MNPPIARDKIARNPDGSLRITQRFNPPAHMGVDYSCVVGTPIYAAADGTARRGDQGDDGFGRYIRIEARDSVYIYTAHLSEWSVYDYALVHAGQQIGLSGDTGNSTGPHLHFEVRQGVPGQPRPTSAAAIDPEPLIEWPGETRTMLTTLHVQRYQGWQNDFLRDIGAQWGKIVDPPLDTDLFPDVPNVDARFWDDNAAPGYIARGREGGHSYVRDNLARWRRVRARSVAFELPNEPECNSNVGLANLREFTLGAIEEANAQGITLIILNLAEGNPHDNGTGNEAVVAWKLDQLLPAIKAAIGGGHYVGRHCYWRPGVEGPTGRYHALGRLKSDLDVLRYLGVDMVDLKVLVNETGIDGGIASHTPQEGWQDLSNEGEYGGQVAEAERYARTLSQVRALMLFTAGHEPPWDGYDHDEGFCRTLVDPLKAIGGTVTPPVVPPVILPTEPLPNDEQGPPALLAQKARYWAEEMQRQFEKPDLARAQTIRLSLIQLLIRLEHDLV